MCENLGLYNENCARGKHLKFMRHPHNYDCAKVKGNNI